MYTRKYVNVRIYQSAYTWIYSGCSNLRSVLSIAENVRISRKGILVKNIYEVAHAYEGHKFPQWMNNKFAKWYRIYEKRKKAVQPTLKLPTCKQAAVAHTQLLGPKGRRIFRKHICVYLPHSTLKEAMLLLCGFAYNCSLPGITCAVCVCARVWGELQQNHQ